MSCINEMLNIVACAVDLCMSTICSEETQPNNDKTIVLITPNLQHVLKLYVNWYC